MIAANSPHTLSECELLLDLLARLDRRKLSAQVLRDAQEIRRQLSMYSFRSSHHAERLCAEIASRYHEDVLALYGSTAFVHRQSDSCYLRLEQLLPLLARIAALRLSRAGELSISHSQLMLGDGMLLRLLQKETADGM